MDARPGWWRLIAAGLLAGAFINACEWAVHAMWLDAAWTAAFAAIGKVPSGWSEFIPANFSLGVIAVWAYRWLSGMYGTSFKTAARVAVSIWIVFWVIPMLAMLPLKIFPDSLLWSVIGVGAFDGTLGTLLGCWIYDAANWRPAAR